MELLINRVSKQFRNKIAVDNISLKLTPGVYGLLGANGAGKNHFNANDLRYFNTGQRDHYAGWKRSRRGRIQGNPGISSAGLWILSGVYRYGFSDVSGSPERNTKEHSKKNAAWK